MIWRLGVAGSPNAHSRSPQLHQAGLAMAGLDGTSRRVELDQEHSAHLLDLMGHSFDALSVTMPLKADAAALCQRLDDAATRTGVVNSLLYRDGALLGACTDGLGFVEAVRAQFSVSLSGARVVVLGAGGAARGIVDALVHGGVELVSVQGRSAHRVGEITKHYENVIEATASSGPVDLLVNTTPAASRESGHDLYGGVSAATIAVDIAYEPTMTPWRSLYEDAGCRTANGLGMLAYQAALQMTWWWNVPIDAARLLEVIA
jgi:shikimate dehydrogenase